MSSNKYKNQVIRLTNMLEGTFQEVQYYKKKETESQREKQLLLHQIQELKKQNDYMLKEKIGKIGRAQGKFQENYSNKNEHENTILLNKMKAYVDKVTEVLRSGITDIHMLGRNNPYTQENALMTLNSIQKGFSKVAMGLMKYQQQLLKNSISKEILKLELQKLRKENTKLFELTSKLQQNFLQSDKTIKKYAQQLKRYVDQNNRLSQENKLLVNFRNQEKYQSLNSHEYEQRKTKDFAKQFTNEILAEKIKGLEAENEILKNEKVASTFKKNEPIDSHIINKIIQEERKLWLSKNQQLHTQIKALKQQLKISEKKAVLVSENEQNFYGMEESKNSELHNLIGIYKNKIEELERKQRQQGQQIQQLRQRLENSEIEKQKIITVYQNQCHEDKDRIIRQEDAIAELEKRIKSYKNKIDDLQKSNNQITYDLQLKQGRLRELEEAEQARKMAAYLNDTQQNMKAIEQAEQKIRKLSTSLKNEVEENNYLKEQLHQFKRKNKGKENEGSNSKLQQQNALLKSEIETIKMDLKEKDDNLLWFEENLKTIKKFLNEIVETWGVEDIFTLLGFIKQKVNRQTEHIKDLTLFRDKILSEQKDSEISFSNERQLILSELNECKRREKQTLEELETLLKIKKSQTEEITTEQAFHRIFKKIKENTESRTKQRSKMNEIESVWQEKQRKLCEQIKRHQSLEIQLNLQLIENKKVINELEAYCQKYSSYDTAGIEKLKTRNLQLEQTVKKLEIQYKQLESQHQQTLIDFSNIEQRQKLTIQELQNDIKQLQFGHQLLQKQKEELENEKKGLEQDKAVMKEQISELNGKVSQKEQADEQIKELKEDIFLLRSDLEHRQLKIQQEKQYSNELLFQVNSLNHLIDAKDIMIEKMKKRTNYLSQSLKELKHHVFKITEDINESSDNFKTFSATIKTQIIQKISHFYQIQEDKIEQMSNQILVEENMSSLSKYMQQNTYEQEIEILKQKLFEKEAEIQEYIEHQSDLNKKISQIESLVQDFSYQISQKNKELEEAQRELKNTKKSLERNKEQFQKIKKVNEERKLEIISLNKQLDEEKERGNKNLVDKKINKQDKEKVQLHNKIAELQQQIKQKKSKSQNFSPLKYKSETLLSPSPSEPQKSPAKRTAIQKDEQSKRKDDKIEALTQEMLDRIKQSVELQELIKQKNSEIAELKESLANKQKGDGVRKAYYEQQMIKKDKIIQLMQSNQYQNKTLAVKLDQICFQLKESQKNNNNLQEEIQGREDQIQKLCSQKSLLLQTIERKRQEVERLSSFLDEQHKKNQLLKQKNNDFAENLKKSKEEVCRYEEKLNNLQKMLNKRKELSFQKNQSISISSSSKKQKQLALNNEICITIKPNQSQTRIKQVKIAISGNDEDVVIHKGNSNQKKQNNRASSKSSENQDLKTNFNEEQDKEPREYSMKSYFPPRLHKNAEQMPLLINANRQKNEQKNIKDEKLFELENELKLTEQYKQILESENENLKKQIARKDKIISKYQQMEKVAIRQKKELEKMRNQINLKDIMQHKIEKQLKNKIEEIVKMNRQIETLRQQIDLQKKRNKNFEELYEKYRMQKKTKTIQ